MRKKIVLNVSKKIEPFASKGCTESRVVRIPWAMPLPRAELPHAKDAPRRNAAFHESSTKCWSGAWKTQRKFQSFDLIALCCCMVLANQVMLCQTWTSFQARSHPPAALLFAGRSHHLAFLTHLMCIVACSCMFELFFVRYLLVVKLHASWNPLPLHPRFHHFWDPMKSGCKPSVHA